MGLTRGLLSFISAAPTLCLGPCARNWGTEMRHQRCCLGGGSGQQGGDHGGGLWGGLRGFLEEEHLGQGFEG